MLANTITENKLEGKALNEQKKAERNEEYVYSLASCILIIVVYYWWVVFNNLNETEFEFTKITLLFNAESRSWASYVTGSTHCSTCNFSYIFLQWSEFFTYSWVVTSFCEHFIIIMTKRNFRQSTTFYFVCANVKFYFSISGGTLFIWKHHIYTGKQSKTFIFCQQIKLQPEAFPSSLWYVSINHLVIFRLAIEKARAEAKWTSSGNSMYFRAVRYFVVVIGAYVLLL